MCPNIRIASAPAYCDKVQSCLKKMTGGGVGRGFRARAHVCRKCIGPREGPLYTDGMRGDPDDGAGAIE